MFRKHFVGKGLIDAQVGYIGGAKEVSRVADSAIVVSFCVGLNSPAPARTHRTVKYALALPITLKLARSCEWLLGWLIGNAVG